MLEREIDLSFISEVWEKDDDNYHRQNIEALLEIKGLKYVSTPRSNNKRGGGAALVANTEKFILDKININIPKPLEAVWGLLENYII